MSTTDGLITTEALTRPLGLRVVIAMSESDTKPSSSMGMYWPGRRYCNDKNTTMHRRLLESLLPGIMMEVSQKLVRSCRPTPPTHVHIDGMTQRVSAQNSRFPGGRRRRRCLVLPINRPSLPQWSSQPLYMEVEPRPMAHYHHRYHQQTSPMMSLTIRREVSIAYGRSDTVYS